MVIAQNGKYAEINGLQMYYEIYGSGSPLVLIHGAASTIQTTFGRLIPELSKTYQIIAVELQAHGHSDNRDGRPITFEQDAEDVVGLLKQLHIGQADFFGFSNGGTTALEIAIHHPAIVKKLIFASSMYKTTEPRLNSGWDLKIRILKQCRMSTNNPFARSTRIHRR